MTGTIASPPAGKAEKTEPMVIEGEISVVAVLESRRRAVHEVVLDAARAQDELQPLAAAARQARAPVRLAPRGEIDALAAGRTHGGVVALVGERRCETLEQIAAQTREPQPWLVMLDGIEDPFNYGQAVRALYAAGAAGLLVRPRTWMGGDAVILRSSAGATERMPTALVADPEAAAAACAALGCRIVATARDKRALSLFDADLSGPLLLLIGGEKRGLRRELLDNADLLLRIPYARRFPHSLGSAGSTAVLAFEMMRRRMAGEE
jgi:23S rRNA (guanosine2251-2'-O)-methyltransferase